MEEGSTSGDLFMELLEQIEKKFLAGISCHDDCTTIVDDCHLIDDLQHMILSRTINNALNTSYPAMVSFQRLFLKHLIHELESKHVEVEENVYNLLVNLMSATDTMEYYRHYKISQRKIVTVKSEFAVISAGTTGLSIWEGSQALAEFCLGNEHMFGNKKLLELGSGVGLTGISVILSCYPSEYIFTDNHDTVLNLIRENVSTSLSTADQTPMRFDDEMSTSLYGDTKVSVMKLAWDRLNDFTADFIIPDLILGADLIYDKDLFQPLCDTLKLFFRRNKNLVAIFACTIRDPATYKDFRDTLSRNHFLVVKLDVPIPNVFHYNENVIKIITIAYTPPEESSVNPDP